MFLNYLILYNVVIEIFVIEFFGTIYCIDLGWTIFYSSLHAWDYAHLCRNFMIIHRLKDLVDGHAGLFYMRGFKKKLIP